MFNKVLYITKSRLHYYPPCVSQIKMLKDLKCDVTVLYGSCEENVLEELRLLGIECVQLSDSRNKLPGALDKVLNWVLFRKSLTTYLKSVEKDTTLLWFGNAETLLPMKGGLVGFSYVVTYLELLDTMKMRLLLLKGMSQKAKAVVTCEETRSYLMKYWFDLKKLPYTMPNKPYAVQAKKNCIPTTDKGRDILKKVNGRKFVIYQGIFQDFDYLKCVAEVLRKEFPDYCFVMMGIDKNHVVDRIKKINPNTIYSDYIPAPKHLEVTANADIGLLFYNPDSLNKAFCAPNKIFEYSYFGLPILGNNIPGLRNTIGSAKAGECVEFTFDNVSLALHKMIEKYNEYTKFSRAFYDSVDNLKTMEAIVNEVQVLKGDSNNERAQ